MDVLDNVAFVTSWKQNEGLYHNPLLSNIDVIVKNVF